MSFLLWPFRWLYLWIAGHSRLSSCWLGQHRWRWYRRWYVRPWRVLRGLARWRLAGMEQPSPWEPLTELYRLGTLPIGFVQGEFVVYAPAPSGKRKKAK